MMDHSNIIILSLYTTMISFVSMQYGIQPESPFAEHCFCIFAETTKHVDPIHMDDAFDKGKRRVDSLL